MYERRDHERRDLGRERDYFYGRRDRDRDRDRRYDERGRYDDRQYGDRRREDERDRRPRDVDARQPSTDRQDASRDGAAPCDPSGKA